MGPGTPGVAEFSFEEAVFGAGERKFKQQERGGEKEQQLACAEVEEYRAHGDACVRRVERVAAVGVWPDGDKFVGLVRVAASVLPDVLARPYPEGDSAGVQEKCGDVRDEFGYVREIPRERCCGTDDKRYGEQREDIAPEAVEQLASLSHVPVPLR